MSFRTFTLLQLLIISITISSWRKKSFAKLEINLLFLTKCIAKNVHKLHNLAAINRHESWLIILNGILKKNGPLNCVLFFRFLHAISFPRNRKWYCNDKKPFSFYCTYLFLILFSLNNLLLLFSRSIFSQPATRIFLT